jgi:AraC-like DNA-binding protein
MSSRTASTTSLELCTVSKRLDVQSQVRVLQGELSGAHGDLGESTRGGDAVSASQRYRERPPRPELRDLVSCVWTLQASSDGPAYEHRSVPNGCAEIAYIPETGHVRLAGPRRESTLERLAPGRTVVGVRLHPGVAPLILGPTGAELVDLTVDADVVWGRSAVTLTERLLDAPAAKDAAGLLEQEILARRSAGHDPDPLIAEALRRMQPWQPMQLADTACELFISPRQLRRRFVSMFGFGPKTMQRILRFQGFLALANANHAAGLTIGGLAAAAGYSDQAHMSHECSRLTGLTPTGFLTELRRSCGPNHDHAASFAPLRRALLQTSRPERELIAARTRTPRPDRGGPPLPVF